MGKIYDLRLINIKDEDDILEFVQLIVAKAPQIADVLKNLKFKRVSLENRIAQAPRMAEASKPDADATVLDQLTGKANRQGTPERSEQDKRLDQMRNAQNTPAVPTTQPTTPAEDADDTLPPAPSKPGDIGTLDLPDVDAKAPEDATAPDLPEASGNLPGQFPVPDDTPSVSEEDAAKAAGSKSEHAIDDGVQPSDTEDEELSDEAKAALEAPAEPTVGAPTADDVESVGSKAARKGTANKRKK